MGRVNWISDFLCTLYENLTRDCQEACANDVRREGGRWADGAAQEEDIKATHSIIFRGNLY